MSRLTVQSRQAETQTRHVAELSRICGLARDCILCLKLRRKAGDPDETQQQMWALVTVKLDQGPHLGLVKMWALDKELGKHIAIRPHHSGLYCCSGPPTKAVVSLRDRLRDVHRHISTAPAKVVAEPQAKPASPRREALVSPVLASKVQDIRCCLTAQIIALFLVHRSGAFPCFLHIQSGMARM